MNSFHPTITNALQFVKSSTDQAGGSNLKIKFVISEAKNNEDSDNIMREDTLPPNNSINWIQVSIFIVFGIYQQCEYRD